MPVVGGLFLRPVVFVACFWGLLSCGPVGGGLLEEACCLLLVAQGARLQAVVGFPPCCLLPPPPILSDLPNPLCLTMQAEEGFEPPRRLQPPTHPHAGWSRRAATHRPRS